MIDKFKKRKKPKGKLYHQMSEQEKAEAGLCLGVHPLPCLQYRPVFDGKVDACKVCAPYVDEIRRYSEK